MYAHQRTGCHAALPQVAPGWKRPMAIRPFCPVTWADQRHHSSRGLDLPRQQGLRWNMAVVAAQPTTRVRNFCCCTPAWVQTDMGNPGAPLAAQDSVCAMCQTIATIKATNPSTVAGRAVSELGMAPPWVRGNQGALRLLLTQDQEMGATPFALLPRPSCGLTLPNGQGSTPFQRSAQRPGHAGCLRHLCA